MLERDGKHLLPVYARNPAVEERGEGVYLFDSSRNPYLDLILPQSCLVANVEMMAGVSAS